MSLSYYLTKQHQARTYSIKPLPEAFVLALCIWCLVFTTSYFIYVHARNAQKGEIREGLIRTAKVIATTLDSDMHRTFIHRDQEQSDQYKKFIKPLEKVLMTDESIVFIYTTTLVNDKVYFIIDPTPEGDADGDGIDDKSHIMERYEDADISLITALKEQKAISSHEPYVDKWGSFMSAYVPFYDSTGEFVGVLGIDINAENYFERLKPMLRATVRAMVAGVFLSFFMGILIWFMRNFVAIINRRRLALRDDYDGLKNEVVKVMNERNSHKPSITN